LFAQTESIFEKRLPLSLLFQGPTIADLAQHVHSPASSRGDSSIIVPFNESGKGLPLYFVHGIQGEVVSFRHLARLLGPEQGFYGIQAPPEMQNPVLLRPSSSWPATMWMPFWPFNPTGLIC
jgi:hypothetical protein